MELCSVELWSVEQRAGARSWRREGRRGGAQADRLSRYIVTGLAIRLPIGVQIVGRPWEEEAVLAVAARIELAGGYREPPMLRNEHQ